MSQIRWGFDSQTPVTYPLGNSRKILFDRVIAASTAATGGQLPSFWGRYVGSVQPLLPPERDFLLSRKIAILLIFNGLKKGDVTGAEKDGVKFAEDAIKAADRAIASERGSVWIYANIEATWEPSWQWMLGWMKRLRSSPYGGVGGFYCYPANSFFDKRLGRALDALEEFAGAKIRHLFKLFVLRPSGQTSVNFAAPQFQPALATSLPKGSVIWQPATDRFPMPIGNQNYHVDICTANEDGFATMLRPR